MPSFLSASASSDCALSADSPSDSAAEEPPDPPSLVSLRSVLAAPPSSLMASPLVCFRVSAPPICWSSSPPSLNCSNLTRLCVSRLSAAPARSTTSTIASLSRSDFSVGLISVQLLPKLLTSMWSPVKSAVVVSFLSSEPPYQLFHIRVYCILEIAPLRWIWALVMLHGFGLFHIRIYLPHFEDVQSCSNCSWNLSLARIQSPFVKSSPSLSLLVIPQKFVSITSPLTMVSDLGLRFKPLLWYLEASPSVCIYRSPPAHPPTPPVPPDPPDFKPIHLSEREENKGKMRFLLGESMGGAVLLLLHRKKPEFWDGAVLVAPMCKIAEEMKPSPLVISILSKLSGVIPTWKIIPGQDIIETAFKQPEIRKQVRENQYCYKGRPRLKTAYELLRISTDLEKRLNEVSLPFIVLHGEDDKVTDKAVSRELYEVASSSDKIFKLYPGMWHGLLYGETPENIEIVFADIIGWLDKRATEGNGGFESELKRKNDGFPLK